MSQNDVFENKGSQRKRGFLMAGSYVLVALLSALAAISGYEAGQNSVRQRLSALPPPPPPHLKGDLPQRFTMHDLGNGVWEYRPIPAEKKPEEKAPNATAKNPAALPTPVRPEEEGSNATAPDAKPR